MLRIFALDCLKLDSKTPLKVGLLESPAKEPFLRITLPDFSAFPSPLASYSSFLICLSAALCSEADGIPTTSFMIWGSITEFVWCMRCITDCDWKFLFTWGMIFALSTLSSFIILESFWCKVSRAVWLLLSVFVADLNCSSLFEGIGFISL